MSTPPADLLSTAQKAFRQTKFYRDLYGTEPVGVDQLPFLSLADYHLANGFLDGIVDVKQMIGILPPYRRAASRFPFTIPEDEAELILRQERIVRAMKHIGVDVSTPRRFLIVTDEAHGPFACELSKGFYWEGHQASLHYLSGHDADLIQAVRAHAPDYVMLAVGYRHRHQLDLPRASIILVDHCNEPILQDNRNPSMLYADEVDLIGARSVGSHQYDYDASQLLMETNPETGLTHITKQKFSCFPLIRYGLGQALPMAQSTE